MIFCFSGTGNPAWAAQQLARRTRDGACDITAMKELPNLKNTRQFQRQEQVYRVHEGTMARRRYAIRAYLPQDEQ